MFGPSDLVRKGSDKLSQLNVAVVIQEIRVLRLNQVMRLKYRFGVDAQEALLIGIYADQPFVLGRMNFPIPDTDDVARGKLHRSEDGVASDFA